jgi:hypothetical protein
MGHALRLEGGAPGADLGDDLIAMRESNVGGDGPQVKRGNSGAGARRGLSAGGPGC